MRTVAGLKEKLDEYSCKRIAEIRKLAAGHEKELGVSRDELLVRASQLAAAAGLCKAAQSHASDGAVKCYTSAAVCLADGLARKPFTLAIQSELDERLQRGPQFRFGPSVETVARVVRGVLEEQRPHRLAGTVSELEQSEEETAAEKRAQELRRRPEGRRGDRHYWACGTFKTFKLQQHRTPFEPEELEQLLSIMMMYPRSAAVQATCCGAINNLLEVRADRCSIRVVERLAGDEVLDFLTEILTVYSLSKAAGHVLRILHCLASSHKAMNIVSRPGLAPVIVSMMEATAPQDPECRMKIAMLLKLCSGAVDCVTVWGELSSIKAAARVGRLAAIVNLNASRWCNRNSFEDINMFHWLLTTGLEVSKHE